MRVHAQAKWRESVTSRVGQTQPQSHATIALSGHAFAGEDPLRARIIEALMCDFRVSRAELLRDFATNPSHTLVKTRGKRTSELAL